MERLYDLEMTGKYDQRAKLAISYQILKRAINMKYIKPCVKSYLRNHLRSQFLEIHYPEWAMAAALPTHRFEKATVRKVWSDSRNMK